MDIQPTISQLASDQKTLNAEEKPMMEDAEEHFKACAGNCPAEDMYQLVELAERTGFSLSPLLEQITVEEWEECVKTLAERSDDENMAERLQRLLPLMAEYPLYGGRLEQYVLERKLLRGTGEIAEVLELLRQYCKSVRREADAVYREEIVMDPDFYALPYQHKFALLMERALEHLDSGNYGECINFLGKAIRAYPQMSTVVGRLSEFLEEKMKEPEQPVSEEFAALGRQVKQMLLGLMENGQWQEAYAVAEQLTSLLPGDLEILKLKQEIMGHM